MVLFLLGVRIWQGRSSLHLYEDALAGTFLGRLGDRVL